MPKNPYEGIPNFEKENFYIRKQEEEELSEIRELTTKDDGEFEIVSPKETDSLRTDCWKSYLNRRKLLEAWSPPEGSPYIKFFKTKTINSMENCIDFLIIKVNGFCSIFIQKMIHQDAQKKLVPLEMPFLILRN